MVYRVPRISRISGEPKGPFMRGLEPSYVTKCHYTFSRPNPNPFGRDRLLPIVVEFEKNKGVSFGALYLDIRSAVGNFYSARFNITEDGAEIDGKVVKQINNTGREIRSGDSKSLERMENNLLTLKPLLEKTLKKSISGHDFEKYQFTKAMRKYFELG